MKWDFSSRVRRHTFLFLTFNLSMVKVKQFLYRPWGFQEVEAHRFQENQQMKLVTWAPAAFTPQEMFLVLISIRAWVTLRAILRPELLCQRKIPVTHREYTRPQPTTSSRTLTLQWLGLNSNITAPDGVMGLIYGTLKWIRYCTVDRGWDCVKS